MHALTDSYGRLRACGAHARCLCTIAWLLFAAPRPAAADAGLAVRYDAPAECPGAEAFARLLATRAQAHEALPVDTQLRVRLERGASWVGTITVLRAELVRGQRSLEAPSCAEAVEALSFVAALLLQDAHREEPPPAPAAPRQPRPHRSHELPSTESSPESSTSIAGDDPAPTPASKERADEPAASSEPAPEPVVQVAARPARRLRARLAGSALVVSGVSPHVQAAFGAHAGVGSSAGALSWSLLAGFRGALPAHVHSGDADTTFRYRAGMVALCAGRSLGAPTLSLCALGEAGRILAQTAAPPSARASYGALGPNVRLAIPLPHRLYLEPGAALLASFRRDHFELGASELFRVPRLTFRAELALGVQLP